MGEDSTGSSEKAMEEKEKMWMINIGCMAQGAWR